MQMRQDFIFPHPSASGSFRYSWISCMNDAYSCIFCSCSLTASFFKSRVLIVLISANRSLWRSAFSCSRLVDLECFYKINQWKSSNILCTLFLLHEKGLFWQNLRPNALWCWIEAARLVFGTTWIFSWVLGIAIAIQLYVSRWKAHMRIASFIVQQNISSQSLLRNPSTLKLPLAHVWWKGWTVLY